MLAICSNITASKVRKRVVVVILSATALTSEGIIHGARQGLLLLWAAIGVLAVMSANGRRKLKVKKQELAGEGTDAVFDAIYLRLIHLYTMDRISNLKK